METIYRIYHSGAYPQPQYTMYSTDADNRYIIEFMIYSYVNDDTVAEHRAFKLVHRSNDLEYDTGIVPVAAADILTQWRYRTWQHLSI